MRGALWLMIRSVWGCLARIKLGLMVMVDGCIHVAVLVDIVQVVIVVGSNALPPELKY